MNIENRILKLKRLVFFVFVIIIFRVFILQVWKHKTYKNISENNIYLNIKKCALRADIYDRNGNVLAKSRPTFKAFYLTEPSKLKYIKNILTKYNQNFLVKPDGIKIENLNWEELTNVFSINELPIPEIEIDQVRTYPFSYITAHIIGYLKYNEDYSYKGTYGVEKVYDNLLNGEAGKDVFLINAKRNRLKKQMSVQAKMKDKLCLTLDIDLQTQAHNALSEHKQGALMIINAQTGAILAAASFPSFNPEDFIFQNSKIPNTQKQKMLLKYYNDEKRPLFNQFLDGAYAPGSTIKPFMVLAMLQKNIPHEYFCNGVFHLGKNSFRCLGNHGRIHLKDALQVSCNYALYAASQYLTQEDLIETWKQFGLGEPILEAFATKTPKFPGKTEWKKIDSLFMQIGQGKTLVTIAQLVRAYARLATGRKIELTLLKQEEENRKEAEHLSIEKKYLETVRNALFETVNKPGGTAFGRYKFINAAGKTGTAQLSKIKEHEYKKSNLIREWKFRDNSIFCAYAPSDKPKVCGCVIIIHGGSGANSAGILLKLLDKAILNQEKEKQEVKEQSIEKSTINQELRTEK